VVSAGPPFHLRIGSRGSKLALWQTRHVAALLHAGHDRINSEIVVLQTTGDRITDVPLAHIGDTGLFTRELDRALLAGEVDAAVHSLKDVPTRLPAGLRLAATMQREDPRDALLVRPGMPASLDALPAGARVGTSSLRRRALLLRRRPDIVPVDLRGNLDTRIEKLHRGDCDATILAAAGLLRLGREAEIDEWLEPPAWLPAPGQGALAVVTRDDDADALPFAPLDDAATRAAVTAERAFLRALEGGCQVPIGALARVTGTRLHLHGFAADDETGEWVAGEETGSTTAAAALGARLAETLLAGEGRQVVERVRARARTYEPAPVPGAP
jgi:hydroxymethylbilane synthase